MGCYRVFLGLAARARIRITLNDVTCNPRSVSPETQQMRCQSLRHIIYVMTLSPMIFYDPLFDFTMLYGVILYDII